MPIYEYQCRECSHRLEKLQKMSDAPLVSCPECGKEALVKLVSAAGFRLKGGGWYETDFKKDGKRNLAGDGASGSASGSDSASSSSGDKSSDSKSTSSDSKSTSSDTKSKSSDTSSKPAAASSSAT